VFEISTITEVEKINLGLDNTQVQEKEKLKVFNYQTSNKAMEIMEG
jgi:hypothetical protein